MNTTHKTDWAKNIGMFCGVPTNPLGPFTGCITQISLRPHELLISHLPTLLALITGPITIAIIGVWLLRGKFQENILQLISPKASTFWQRILLRLLFVFCTLMTLFFLIVVVGLALGESETKNDLLEILRLGNFYSTNEIVL